MAKRKAVWLILLGVAVGLIGGVQAFSGAAEPKDMCVPMGKIAIKAPEGVEAKRSAVDFPHAQHFDIDLHHLPPHLGRHRADFRVHDLRVPRPGGASQSEARRTAGRRVQHRLFQGRLPQAVHQLPQGEQGQEPGPAEGPDDLEKALAENRAHLLLGMPSQMNSGRPMPGRPEFISDGYCGGARVPPVRRCICGSASRGRG